MIRRIVLVDMASSLGMDAASDTAGRGTAMRQHAREATATREGDNRSEEWFAISLAGWVGARHEPAAARMPFTVHRSPFTVHPLTDGYPVRPSCHRRQIR